jgi:hypothetical protein
MILNSVILAVEDELGEAISTKILNSFGIEIRIVLREGGNAYLRQKAPELNISASGMDIFLLTDLDSPEDCPPGLIRSWIKGTLNPKFFFRVAVMEVESWLMADRAGFANFLSIPIHRIPSPTDDILKPKEYLVSLARRSKKRRLRDELVPEPGAKIPVGYGYNTRLMEFVRDYWDLERAAVTSPSLKRTLDRLDQEKNSGAKQ